MIENFDKKTILEIKDGATEYRWTFFPRIFKKPYCKTSLKAMQFNLFLSYLCVCQYVLQSLNSYFQKTKAYFSYTVNIRPRTCDSNLLNSLWPIAYLESIWDLYVFVKKLTKNKKPWTRHSNCLDHG